MSFSLRTTLLSLSALAMVAVSVPACDDGEYEALGVSAEELDAMTPEALDELALDEDPIQPHPPAPQRPLDLVAPSTHAVNDEAPEMVDGVALPPPPPTHAVNDEAPESVPGLQARPRPTHAVDPVIELGGTPDDEGCDTHEGSVIFADA
jgi:hypothetical protein